MQSGGTARANSLYKSWHEFESTDVLAVDVPEVVGTLKTLGKMHRLDYTSDKWNKGRDVYYYHHFKKNAPLLCQDEAGNYFIDGNIKITPLGIDDWDSDQKRVVKRPSDTVTKLGILEMIAYEDPVTKKASTVMFGDRYYCGDPDGDYTFITEPVNIPVANPSVRNEIHNILRANELALDSLDAHHPQHTAARAALKRAGLGDVCMGVGDRENPIDDIGYSTDELYHVEGYPFPMRYKGYHGSEWSWEETLSPFDTVTIPRGADVRLWQYWGPYCTVGGWWDKLNEMERPIVLSRAGIHEEGQAWLRRFLFVALKPNVQAALTAFVSGTTVEAEARPDGHFLEEKYYPGDWVLPAGRCPGVVSDVFDAENRLRYMVVWDNGSGVFEESDLTAFEPYDDYRSIPEEVLNALTPPPFTDEEPVREYYASIKYLLANQQFKVGCYYRTRLCPVPLLLESIDSRSSRPYKLRSGRVVVEASACDIEPFSREAIKLSRLTWKQRCWMLKLTFALSREVPPAVESTMVLQWARFPYELWAEHLRKAETLFYIPDQENIINAVQFTLVQPGSASLSIGTEVTLKGVDFKVVAYVRDGWGYVLRSWHYGDTVMVPIYYVETHHEVVAQTQVVEPPTARERWEDISRVDTKRILFLLGYDPESTVSPDSVMHREVVRFLDKHPVLPWLSSRQNPECWVGPDATVVYDTLETSLLGDVIRANPKKYERLYILLDHMRDHTLITDFIREYDKDKWITSTSRREFGDKEHGDAPRTPVVMAMLDTAKFDAQLENCMIALFGFTINAYNNAEHSWILVRPDRRGEGIGAKIIDFRDRFLTKLGINRVYTTVKVGNARSRNMLDSAGYYVYSVNDNVLRVVKQLGTNTEYLPIRMDITLRVSRGDK